MRVEAKWTPGGTLLWVIAAVVATLAVCYGKPSVTDDQSSAVEVDFEVDEGGQ